MVKKRVIKSDGTKQLFNESKILNSLKRAGASNDLAMDTARKINDQTGDKVPTEDIYRNALETLQKKEPKSALKYSLKRAVMDMGPDGYTFEKFVTRIFKAQGFETEHGMMVTGKCIKHELDVIAQKDRQIYIIECKYHNDPGAKSDIKTALYVHSRYLDVKEEFCPDDRHEMRVLLATNTKVTSDVKKYAKCVGMDILAWEYPRVKNLQYYIEAKDLYPISIFSNLADAQKDTLYENDVITARDLDFIGRENLVRLTGIDDSRSKKIFEELDLLLYG